MHRVSVLCLYSISIVSLLCLYYISIVSLLSFVTVLCLYCVSIVSLLSTPQRTDYNTLQHNVSDSNEDRWRYHLFWNVLFLDEREFAIMHCNTLQHTATHCNAHFYCVFWNVLFLDEREFAQKHYDTLQDTTTHCNMHFYHLFRNVLFLDEREFVYKHYCTQQHTTTHYKILQHTLVPCISKCLLPRWARVCEDWRWNRSLSLMPQMLAWWWMISKTVCV